MRIVSIMHTPRALKQQGSINLYNNQTRTDCTNSWMIKRYYNIISVFLAQKWCWFIELNLISGSGAGVMTPNDKKCYHFDH